jgi:hypothetical protein
MAGFRFKIWKSIKLGGHRTANDFRTAIESAGCYVAATAEDILGSAVVNATDRERTIDVVVMSTENLGLKRFATYDEICTRARELGLVLCPAEVGPHLRLQHEAQSFTEWLYIGMRPVVNSSGRLVIFSVDRSFGARYLGTRFIATDSNWIYNGQFVFAIHDRN